MAIFLNLIVSILLLIFVIFRDDLKGIILKPKLRLRFLELGAKGERTKIGNLDAFYWHLEAKNLRPWRAAIECNLVILDAKVHSEWRDPIQIGGDIFVKQRHLKSREDFDLGYNKRYFDLFRIINGRLNVMTASPSPGNFEAWLGGEGTLELEVQLIAVNAASPKYNLTIHWDGNSNSESIELSCERIKCLPLFERIEEAMFAD